MCDEKVGKRRSSEPHAVQTSGYTGERPNPKHPKPKSLHIGETKEISDSPVDRYERSTTRARRRAPFSYDNKIKVENINYLEEIVTMDTVVLLFCVEVILSVQRDTSRNARSEPTERGSRCRVSH
ncbi:hypothetical protein EVAR_88762_1 [Eumeta japonica]|uniref:Uncharacterized protein n=1 Tax=Eumeta variegata TaxID=151549 RepID=A0A4C1XSG1_EUMVA|nr:hypothetical protein EVAR_88762_1 [Eumeta japonica]